MFLSSLYAFTDDTAGEELIIDAGTDFVSDVLDLQAADINNGGGEVYLNLYCLEVDDDVAGDVDITFLFEKSILGSTFQTFASKIVNCTVGNADHDLLAVGQLVKMQLPEDLPRYLRITSSSASITGTATFKAFLSTS
jgi:hypothetical protein